MGAAVQFVGKKAVMLAYNKKGLTKWALLCSKSILASYDGSSETDSEQELEDWLDMIRGNTTAIYTLKFYDPSVKTIRPGTEEIASFNFRVSEELQPSAPGMMGSAGFDRMEALFTKLTDRMDAMEKKLAGVDAKKDDPEKLETWEKLLDNPIVMAGIAKVFDIDVNGILETSAKLNGVPGSQGSFEDTMNVLRSHDPNIEDDLYKLSLIATRKPEQFKTLVGMLRSMSI